jgi:hypothetical protein
MAETAEQMEVCNLLGVFYEEGGRLMVADEHEGAQEVATALAPVSGVLVHVLAHHRPPEPPLKDRWGGGSCHLEGSGHCHCGHHERSQWIYTFNHTGVFGPESWTVTDTKGAEHAIRMDWLVGHRSQIVVVSMPDFEQMAEKVRSLDPDNLKNARLEDLQARATEIRDYLTEINKLKDNL